jgi:thioredoxin reductase (NADPH)
MPPTKLHYRIAIIGSGPAGWTAALYSARADLEPIVIQGKDPGGQLMTTTEVENYPGFEKGIQGPEMMEVFKRQAERFGTEVLYDIVTDIDFEARPFRLTLDSGGNLTADAVIIATGATAKLLGIPSEKLPGVSAWGVRDGAAPG